MDKGLVLCGSNGWMTENMDKGLTLPKLVLIVWLIPQMPQNWPELSPQAKKFWISMKKRLYWDYGVCSPWIKISAKLFAGYIYTNLPSVWYNSDKHKTNDPWENEQDFMGFKNTDKSLIVLLFLIASNMLKYLCKVFCEKPTSLLQEFCVTQFFLKP